MTRAYIRLDPAFIDHKSSYPDGPYAALVDCLCLAEQQPDRGRFRSERYLRALLDRRARFVGYLIEHRDLILLADGRLYVDGWDEWQEGDWKVGERVQRIRGRRHRTPAVTPPVTPHVTVEVTPEATPPDVPPVRLDLHEGAGAGAGVPGAGAGVGGDGASPPAVETDEPEAEVLTYLARHGCYITPGNGYHRKLVLLVERYGSGAVLRSLNLLARHGVEHGDTKGFVFGAEDNLRKRPDMKALRAEEVAAIDRAKSERLQAETRRLTEEQERLAANTPMQPLRELLPRPR